MMEEVRSPSTVRVMLVCVELLAVIDHIILCQWPSVIELEWDMLYWSENKQVKIIMKSVDIFTS